MNKNILVVDDEKSLLRTMKFIIKAAHYNVDTADNGLMAFEKILMAKKNKTPFDILITDLNMPFLSGEDLIERLFRMNIHLPIILITGLGIEQELEIRLRRKGCLRYLIKPFTENEFIGEINSVLS